MTINQLTKNPRKFRLKRVDSVLGNAPHRKGVCTKVYIMSPKKPNSANRACAKLMLSTGNSTKVKKRKQEVIAYIPYQNARSDVKVHGVVLIERRNKVDLPGVRYVVKRGTRDVSGVINARKNRSRKGTKRPSC